MIIFFSKGNETTDNAYVQADIVNLSSEVVGTIKAINFQENQYVKQGDLLILIDDEIYQSDFNIAKSEYAISLLDKEISSVKLEQAKYNIVKAESDLGTTNAELTQAFNEYKREKNLLDNKFASQKNFESAETTFAKRNNNVKGLKAALANAEKDLQLAEMKDKQNTLALNKSISELKKVEKSLNNTKIFSPCDGYVANKVIEKGNLVVLGTPLVSVVPTDVYIVANFKETQISKMKSMQKVTIKLDGFSKENLKGEIESISPASGAVFSLLPPQNATGNFTKIVQRYPVKIKFTDKGNIADLIKPGLSAEVKVGIN